MHDRSRQLPLCTRHADCHCFFMSELSSDHAFTTSMRTRHGRVLVHITCDAMRELGAGEAITELEILDRHIERLKAVALEKSSRTDAMEVQVDAPDIWWTGVKR